MNSVNNSVNNSHTNIGSKQSAVEHSTDDWKSLHDCTCQQSIRTQDNDILNGVIVNGFHPQLLLWNERKRKASEVLAKDGDLNDREDFNGSDNGSDIGNGNGNVGSTTAKQLNPPRWKKKKTFRVAKDLSDKIQEKVERARVEVEVEVDTVQFANDSYPFGEVVVNVEGRTSDDNDIMMMTTHHQPSTSELNNDFFEKSNVPQLILAPGGRIAAGK